ncbi:MAG: ComF family protein [Gammaproteobacteria bacterium]|nr:ComF family protein [Gammaproteobacteria bacterium]
MNSLLRRLYSNLPSIPCRLCGSPSQEYPLCCACINDLPLLGPACPRCAMPTTQGQLCGQCLSHPPEQDQSISLFRYHEPIKRLIADLKYHDKLYLTQLFAHLMSKKLIHSPLPHCLIPIPLHPKRLRQRGYNQSLELANSLSKQLNIPVSNRYLSRIINTPPQASLPFKQRKSNIQHAFKLMSSNLPSHIALVDDVLTTGHTANIAAKLLRQKGIKIIEVWTIARTIRHD